MNIDVAKAIKELLFERDSVILPGLGAFIGKPSAAEVDYVQGAVQPPTKKLEFNTNIVINDGVLINYIQKNSLVTGQEAKMAIEEYVKSVKNALEQKEIVDIPDIGRLYKDYEQKIRFMPEGTNFETGSFGLPNVKFHPVVRRKTTPPPSAKPSKGKPKPAASKAAPAQPKVPPSPSIPQATKTTAKSWAEQFMPWLIALAAVLLAITLFLSLRGCGDQGATAEVPPERINVKPTEESALEADAADEGTATIENLDDADPLEEEEAAPPPTYHIDEETDRPANNGASGNNKVEQLFVVVHSFGNRANAKTFAKQLEKAGYIAVEKKHNGLRRVGVEVPSTRRHEVDNLIRELGRKFKAKPVLVDY